MNKFWKYDGNNYWVEKHKYFNDGILLICIFMFFITCVLLAILL
jgi:hypothetical protein